MRLGCRNHYLRSFIYIVAVFITAFFLYTGIVLAQSELNQNSNANPRVEEINNKLKILEKQVDSLDKSIERNISTITNVSQSGIEALATMYKILIGIIVLIVGVFTFLAYTVWNSFKRMRDEIKLEFGEKTKEYDDLIQKLQDMEINHTAKVVLDDLSELMEKAETEFKSSTPSSLYDLGLVRVREVLEMNPSDNKVLASIYAWKGYLLKRKGYVADALTSIEKGYELNPDNTKILYNSACYASMVGDKDKALSYLERTLKKLPEWKDLIIKYNGGNNYKLLEVDFANIKDEPKFKEILKVKANSIIEAQPHAK